jgi:hypothetical protein
MLEIFFSGRLCPQYLDLMALFSGGHHMQLARFALMSLASALFTAAAQATPLFDVPFTGDTVGNSPNTAPATAGGVSTMPTSATSLVTGVKILNNYVDSQTSAAFGTGNVLAFDPSSGYTQVTAFQGDAADAQSTGVFTVSFDIMEDKGSAATGYVAIGMTDQPGSKVLTGLVLDLGLDADNLRVDTAISSAGLGTLSRGVAHHIDWVVDMDAPYATATSLYIDNVFLTTVPRDPVGGPYDGSPSFGRFKVSRAGDGQGTIVFDNFVIVSGNAVPEPAAISLLGMSALTMLRRRK